MELMTRDKNVPKDKDHHECDRCGLCAVVLRKMKADPRLEKLGNSVNKIHRTAAGDLPMKLQRTANVKATELWPTVEAVLETGTKISKLQHEIVFKIKDLDIVIINDDIFEVTQ